MMTSYIWHCFCTYCTKKYRYLLHFSIIMSHSNCRAQQCFKQDQKYKTNKTAVSDPKTDVSSWTQNTTFLPYFQPKTACPTGFAEPPDKSETQVNISHFVAVHWAFWSQMMSYVTGELCDAMASSNSNPTIIDNDLNCSCVHCTCFMSHLFSQKFTSLFWSTIHQVVYTLRLTVWTFYIPSLTGKPEQHPVSQRKLRATIIFITTTVANIVQN